MPITEKKKVIAYLREHPNSLARDIFHGCGMEKKVHSAALYSMKKTGLIIATQNEDETYPRYSVNPDASPEELENPRLIFKRARGPQKHHRLGCIEERILNVMDYEEARDLQAISDAVGKDVRRAYISKLLIRMKDIGYVATKGDDYMGPWVKLHREE